MALVEYGGQLRLQRAALRDAPCHENGRSCLEEAECRPTAYDFTAQVARRCCKPGCDLGEQTSQCGDGDRFTGPTGFR